METISFSQFLLAFCLSWVLIAFAWVTFQQIIWTIREMVLQKVSKIGYKNLTQKQISSLKKHGYSFAPNGNSTLIYDYYFELYKADKKPWWM